MMSLSVEQWAEMHKPIVNTITPESSFDFGDGGMMYETYGDDLTFVLEVANENPRNVWTLIEGKDDAGYIVNGYRLVNRIGYFVTEEPAEAGSVYEIKVS
jgi:hypothetical protein